MTYKIPRVARGAHAVRRAIDVAAAGGDPSAELGDKRGPFLSFSAVLTGFSELELVATGVGDSYLGFLSGTFPEVIDELLRAWHGVKRDYPPAQREAGIRDTILPDAKLGPFARGLLSLWYTATWAQMPADWSQAYGDHHDVTGVIKGAYPEGLVWRAGGLHPQGAKPTGFGSWALPPEVV